jgi:hypothetical protein
VVMLWQILSLQLYWTVDFEEILDSLPRRLKCLVCSSNAAIGYIYEFICSLSIFNYLFWQYSIWYSSSMCNTTAIISCAHWRMLPDSSRNVPNRS